jgi:hypothetical protein
MEEVQEGLGNLHHRPLSGRVSHGPAFFVSEVKVKNSCSLAIISSFLFELLSTVSAL